MPTTAEQEVLDEISQVPGNSVQRIPFHLYDKQYRKTTKLADVESGATAVKGRSDWYRFDFTEPVFVQDNSH
jgi:hypothetical protein